MSTAGAAAPIAAAGMGLMMLTTVMLLVFNDSDQSSQTCGPQTSQTSDSGSVLAGPVSPAAAEQPAQAASAPSVPGRRSMPLAENTYTISDTFGARGGAHLGVDMAAAAGTPIYAAMDGKVVAAGPASGFGNWIVVDSIDEQGQPVSTVYGHEFDSGIGVRVGETVTAGQQIGSVGSAGESSGPHLHFEVVPGGRFAGGKQIDPMPWLQGAATPAPDVQSPRSGTSTAPSAPSQCPPGFGTAGGQLADGSVPAELEPWYRKAGSLCPQISASLLAAQGKQESGFRRGLTSPSGAQGLAQFLPSTATAIDPLDGQPYVIDADGNGTASVWDDGDAIVGQGRYMCALADQIDKWKAEGTVHGDTATLALAAYNAGENAVRESGGVPPYSETTDYVRIITGDEPNFRAAGSTGRFIPTPDGASGSQIVDAARGYVGTPYVWGGGGPAGPSGGGFDCSGLTSYAVHAATGVTLPRTSEQQWSVGIEIPMDQVQPGDLVFGEFGANGLPGHVGIAVGGGRMIHAPQTGETVTEADIQPGMRARRVS